MNTVEIMRETLPALNVERVPSQRTISRSSHLCRYINMLQAVEFFENSSVLGLCFDGTVKKKENITAVIFVNELQQSMAVHVGLSVYQDSEAIALDIQAGLDKLGMSAFQAGLLKDEVNSFAWTQRQMSKLKTILTDSCPSAKKSARELKEILPEFFEFENEIVLLDCSLHLIMNYEKQCYRSLCPEPFQALTLLSTLFSGQTQIRTAWCSKYPELSNCFQRTVGVRFSQTSSNALQLIRHWDIILQFLETHAVCDAQVFTLLGLLKGQQNLIFSEVLALSSIWYALVEPAWNRLQVQDLFDAVSTCDDLITFSNKLVTSSDPGAELFSPSENKFIRLDPDSSAVVFGKASELSASFDSYLYTDIYYRRALQDMARNGAKYVHNLRKTWDMDNLSSLRSGLTLSNQRNESFFAVLDMMLRNHQSKTIASRLEVAKSKFNGAFEFLMNKGYDNAVKIIAQAQKHRPTLANLSNDVDSAAKTERLEKESFFQEQVSKFQSMSLEIFSHLQTDFIIFEG